MEDSHITPLTATQVRQRLEFLATLSYGFLESGEMAGEVEPLIRRQAKALGIENLGFNSFGRILLIDTTREDGSTVSVSGAARSLDLIDCTRARDLLRLAEDTTEDLRALAPDDAAQAAPSAPGRHPKAATEQTRHTTSGITQADSTQVVRQAQSKVEDLRQKGTPWWVLTSGLTLLAFCICMQVGVTWQAWTSAAAVQLVSSLVGVATGRSRMPKLFAIAAQGCVAGALATLLVQLGFVSPVGAAAAIAVNWLILLPLPQVIGAVLDAINADYVSATTRVASVAVAALGIVVAGAFTFSLGELLGMEHPRLDSVPSLPWYLVLVFSALGAIANAFANGGRLPLLLPAATFGIVTGAVNLLGLHVFSLPTVWANALAAVVLGCMASYWGRRTGFPAQVLALMGITGALMPGIPVFFGILQQMGGANGWNSFGTAGIICVSISAGVALGGYLMGVLRDTVRSMHAHR